MKLTLVNTDVLVLPDDPLTTGIPYFPIGLAYAAASLRAAGHEPHVVDGFGLAPRSVRPWARWWLQGLAPEEIAARVAPDSRAVLVYAGNIAAHEATMAIIRSVARARPDLPVAVLENTQAVTAYSLRGLAAEFFAAGATAVITGELDERVVRYAEALSAGAPPDSIDGIFVARGGAVVGSAPQSKHLDLDSLPFPAWDLFPLEAYWGLGFAHGPVEARRMLPLQTSRGCPYPCSFCVVPEMNDVKWRPRSMTSVVDEMAHGVEKFGVREFHIEDLNPTIHEERIRSLCREIIARGLKVKWKIVAGTKLDILKDLDTLDLMAEAGCRYISMSPESGSKKVLDAMKKPFRHDVGLQLTRRMHRVGIRSQACFVLGFPGETDADRTLTRQYIHALVKAGLDEIALFICVGPPGSDIHAAQKGYESLSDMTFTPVWREDYAMLKRFRLGTYARFLLWKLIYSPLKLLRQPFNFLSRRFETKMEMVPYRALMLGLWRMKSEPQRTAPAPSILRTVAATS